MIFFSRRIPYLALGNTFKKKKEVSLLFFAYGIIAISIYLLAGLGEYNPQFKLNSRNFGLIAGFFVLPSLIEELVWRWVLISPTVLGSISGKSIKQILISSIIFTAAHPIAAILFVPHARDIFFQPAFLLIVFLLGMTCGTSYVLTKSIWPSVIIHWLTVLAWKFLFGGPFVMLGR